LWRLGALLFAFVCSVSLAAWNDLTRTVQSIAATPVGSVLVIDILDYTGKHLIFAAALGSKEVLWQQSPKNIPTALAISPDGHTVAVGMQGVGASEAGVLLLDVNTGKQIAALGWDEHLDFVPGQTYPRWGAGISKLIYSSDGTILYGLSNDTLFAWDGAARRYLWTRDVPAVIEAPKDQPDPLPYGHATTFALSPDGRQIAAARETLRIATAGRTRPAHFITRGDNLALDFPAQPAFSADSRILAAGELNTAHGHGTPSYATEFWLGSSPKSQKIDDCGGGIAWTYDPNVLACQNRTGAHLRNIHDPQKNIGPAGPVSDLPLLKVGNSLWAAAYRFDDWKDPTKPLPLTLVELGTGKRVTVSLPGRQ
jgi:hypothetical protein